MESGSTENRNATEPLTEEQRAAVFAQTNAPIGRDGLARIGRPPIPQNFVMVVVAIFVILGLGGVVIEHYFGGVGTTGPATTTATLTTVLQPSALPTTSSMQAFMGLKEIASATAPPIALRDQTGQVWQLDAQRGRVVVLTFFDQTCNDICPIEGAEIKSAIIQLGARARHVEFVIVNTDPHHVNHEAAPRALTVPQLLGLRGVYFVTGSLAELNAIWVHYGLTVKVGPLATQIAHNDIVYFVDPKGKLRVLAVPFANEDHRGVFTLATTDIQRFARGLASESISLAK